MSHEERIKKADKMLKDISKYSCRFVSKTNARILRHQLQQVRNALKGD